MSNSELITLVLATIIVVLILKDIVIVIRQHGTIKDLTDVIIKANANVKQLDVVEKAVTSFIRPGTSEQILNDINEAVQLLDDGDLKDLGKQIEQYIQNVSDGKPNVK